MIQTSLTTAQVSDRELGQWFGANLQTRPLENSCLMALSTLRVLDILQSALSPSSCEKLSSLRGRGAMDVKEMIVHHQQLLYKVAEAGKKMLNYRGECVLDYRSACAVLVRQDLKLAHGPTEAARLANASVLPFAKPEMAVKLANELVNKTTSGHIPTILDALDDDTAAVAVAAALLNCNYMHGLESTYSDKDNFITASGEKIKDFRFKWLEGFDNYRTTEMGSLRLIDIPCKGDISLTFFQSIDPKTWKEAYQNISADDWSNLCEWIYTNNDAPQFMRVLVPHLKMECSTDYLEVFEKHPIVQLLTDENYNPSWVSGGHLPVKLTKFVDKHKFELSEEGFLMAGAAAAVGGEECCSSRPEYNKEMKFTYPFGFIVSHRGEKTMLSTGFIADGSKK